MWKSLIVLVGCQLLFFITTVCQYYLFILKYIDLFMKIAINAGIAITNKQTIVSKMWCFFLSGGGECRSGFWTWRVWGVWARGGGMYWPFRGGREARCSSKYKSFWTSTGVREQKQPAAGGPFWWGGMKTVPADGHPEFAVWTLNCFSCLLWHCFFLFRILAGMWTVLLLPMQSITFDPKLKVKELTHRKRTRKMRAGQEKWVFVIVFSVLCFVAICGLPKLLCRKGGVCKCWTLDVGNLGININT